MLVLLFPVIGRAFMLILRTENAFFFWVRMEIFMFFSLLIIKKERLLYFTVQTTAGLLILGGLVLSSTFLLQVGLMVKLGMFPFQYWVIGVLNSNPTTVILTLLFPAKLPLYSWRNGNLILVRALFTIMVGAMLAIFNNNLKQILIARSVTSTGILVLCSIKDIFNSFFWFYLVSFFFLLISSTKLKHGNSVLFRLRIFNIIGFPPLPMFFAKVSLLGTLQADPFLLGFTTLIFLVASLYYIKLLKWV